MAKKNGIINGYADGNFLPNGTITLPEAMKIVLSGYKVDVSNYGSFETPGSGSIVKIGNDWFVPYMDYFVKNLHKDYLFVEINDSDVFFAGNFSPQSLIHKISRGEMAYFIEKIEHFIVIEKLVPLNPEEKKSFGSYGKNEKNIYVFFDDGDAKKLEKADVKTFTQLKNGLYADKNFVFTSRMGMILPNIVSSQYTPLFAGYGLYNNKIYFFENEVRDADVNSFVFDEKKGVVKDKNFVFIDGESIKGIDADSFESIMVNSGDLQYQSSYVKDKTGVFYKSSDYDSLDFKKLEGFDVATAKLITSPLIADKNSVFFKGKKIEGADGKTFEHIGFDYYKDAKNIYFIIVDVNILGVDYSTFQIKTENELLQYDENGRMYDAKDKNGTFNRGKRN